MKTYKDQNGKYFGLLYIQNQRNTKGGATPSVEPTWWFLPLEVKKQGRIPAGLGNVPGAWPQPIAENLVSRLLTEFTGSVKDVTTAGNEAEPDKNTKKEEKE